MANGNEGNEDLGTELTTARIEIKLKKHNIFNPGWVGEGQAVLTQSSKRPGT